MAQAIRERTNELAVLKTLGFSDGRILALVLAESCSSPSSAAGSAWRCRRLIVPRGDPTNGMLPPSILPARDVVARRRLIIVVLGLRPGCCRPSRPAGCDRRRAEEEANMMLLRRSSPSLASTCGRSRSALGSSAVAVVGIAGVVIVFVGGAVDRRRLPRAMKTAGDADRCMVMRAGADTEMTSGLSGDEARIIQDAPGIARDSAGGRWPRRSCSSSSTIRCKRRGTAGQRAAARRQPEAFQVRDEGQDRRRPDVRAGTQRDRRRPRRGASVHRPDGRSALRSGENSGQVVGIFEAGGIGRRVRDLVRRKVLQPAYRRGNTYQSVSPSSTSPDVVRAVEGLR